MLLIVKNQQHFEHLWYDDPAVLLAKLPNDIYEVYRVVTNKSNVVRSAFVPNRFK